MLAGIGPDLGAIRTHRTYLERVQLLRDHQGSQIQSIHDIDDKAGQMIVRQIVLGCQLLK